VFFCCSWCPCWRPVTNHIPLFQQMLMRGSCCVARATIWSRSFLPLTPASLMLSPSDRQHLFVTAFSLRLGIVPPPHLLPCHTTGQPMHSANTTNPTGTGTTSSGGCVFALQSLHSLLVMAVLGCSVVKLAGWLARHPSCCASNSPRKGSSPSMVIVFLELSPC
jgi:hypothetical protein